MPLNLSHCLHPACRASNVGELDHCQRCGSLLRLAGRYRAVQTLGHGGFACTFRAVDEHCLNSPCVIKQFWPRQQDSATVAKAYHLFQQEAQLLKKLGGHPQIPELLAYLEQDGEIFIVQTYLQGQTLLQEYNQYGCFEEGKIRHLLRSLLPVLQFVHDHQVMHRDIKPENIMRGRDGSLCLIDFGSSYQIVEGPADRPTAKTATLGYAAPEQLRGQVLPTSDLYSLGLTCLRLLTGHFLDDRAEDPLWNETAQSWRWPESDRLSPSLQALLATLLQPDPTDRFSSAQAALAALVDQSEFPQQMLAEPLSVGQSGPTDLMSPAGLDCRHLSALLAAHRYQEAETETWTLLLELAHCSQPEQFDLSAIEALPCDDLYLIDHLWWTYSQGRFGFRVQWQLYQSLGGTTAFDFQVWKAFAERVGWCQDTHWLTYAELTFTAQAPIGHLPMSCMDRANRNGSDRGVCGWWRLGFVALMQRLEACPLFLESL